MKNRSKTSIVAALFAASLSVSAIACTGEQDAPIDDEGPVQGNSHNITAQWLSEIVAAKDSHALLDVLTRYDSQVLDADKRALSGEASNNLLMPYYVRLKRADLLHELGQFAEAVDLYGEAMAMSDQPVPRSFIAFRQVLARHGGQQFDIMTKADASLVEDLKAIENQMVGEDAFSADLDYQIAMATFFAGTPDIARILRVADRIDPSEPTDTPLSVATTLSVAVKVLADAGQTADATRLFAKLVEFDRIHNTGLSQTGMGALALNN